MIHPKAIVETDNVGSETHIMAFAHVLPGAHIGVNCSIGGHTHIEGAVRIGDNVTIKNAVSLPNGVTVHDDAFIGQGAVFTNEQYPRSARSPLLENEHNSDSSRILNTTVGKGCSIGAGAVICPGIAIGAYSMIGAGAVVTHDVPAFALVVGNPAQRIGYVCRRGHRLAGNHSSSVCQQCGETPDERIAQASSTKDHQCIPQPHSVFESVGK